MWGAGEHGRQRKRHRRLLGLLATLGVALEGGRRGLPQQSAVHLIALAAALLDDGVWARSIRWRPNIDELCEALPLADIDPFTLGVRPGRGVDYRGSDDRPFYLHRRIERQLGQALGEHALVVLVGPPASGKTRTALERLRALPPGHELRNGLLIRPRAPDRLADLMRLPHSALCRRRLRRLPVVLWLDDLDEHLVEYRLTDEMIRDAMQRRPRMVIFGTLRSDREWELRRRDPRREPMVDDAVLERFAMGSPARLEMPVGLEPAEEELARGLALQGGRRLPVDEMVVHPGEGARIGEWCSGVDLLREAWRRGHPREGVELVNAALDWQRLGLGGGIPDALLRDLTEAYLGEASSSQRDGQAPRPPQARESSSSEPDDRTRLAPEVYEAARSWAMRELESQTGICLLGRASGEPGLRYRAAEILERERDEQHGTGLPAVAWEIIAKHHVIAPERAIALGQRAVDRCAPDAAERIWLPLIDRGGRLGASAALALGRLLAMSGRRSGDAAAMLHTASWLDPADTGVVAKAFLGALLVAEPRTQPDGRQLLQEAVTSGVQAARAWGLLASGRHLAHAQLYGESAQALTEAVGTRHREVAPVAAVLLAHLLLRRALAAPDDLPFEVLSPFPFVYDARVHLLVAWSQAPLELDSGMEVARAQRAARRAWTSGHPSAALNAGILLQDLLYAQGKADAALDVLNEARQRPAPSHDQACVAYMFSARLYSLLFESRTPSQKYGLKDAQAAAREATQRGDLATRAFAALLLAVLLDYEVAVEVESDDFANRHATVFRVPREYVGEESAELERTAIALGLQLEASEGRGYAGDLVTMAQVNLGHRLWRAEGAGDATRSDEVEGLFRSSADRGHPDAQLWLGEWLSQHGRPAEAAHEWGLLADQAPDTPAGQRAALALYVLLSNDPARQEEALERLNQAAGGPAPDIRATAQEYLRSLTEQG